MSSPVEIHFSTTFQENSHKMLYLLTQEIHFLGIYPKEIYKDLDNNLCKMVLFTKFHPRTGREGRKPPK